MKKFRHISAIILAGGKSTRMNRTKALLTISGKSLIEKSGLTLQNLFDEVIVSANSFDIFRFLPYPVVADETPDCGPLMGILTGLKASKHAINFIIACDIPEIDINFLNQLIPFTEDYDIVVPTIGKDKQEPLFAFYHKNTIPRIEMMLRQGIRKINRLFTLGKTRYVPMEDNHWYYNLNTNEDLQRYLNAHREKLVMEQNGTGEHY